MALRDPNLRDALIESASKIAEVATSKERERCAKIADEEDNIGIIAERIRSGE